MRISRAWGPPVVDVLVAVGFLVAALTEVWLTSTAPGPRDVGTAVAFLSAVPLAWRRRAPEVAVAGAMFAILLPLVRQPLVETDGLFVTVAWLVAVHAINAYRPALNAAVGTLAVVVSAMFMTVTQAGPPGQRAGNVAWVLVIFGSAAAAGQVMRNQRARLVQERVAAEEQARAVERRSLAREVHDVVAHGIAVMVVQTGAAQELLRTNPDRASRLLDAVQRSGEQSAAELRRMLDLLGGEPAAIDPQPRLADLADLVDRVRASGIDADLDVSSAAVDVAPGLQVTAYRVVQESLTNAIKHGRRSAVTVKVSTNGDDLIVTVDDQASDGRSSSPKTSGRGLPGLQERVRPYGGVLQAGPQGSCWRVHAVLPLQSGAPSTSTVVVQGAAEATS